MKTLKLMIEKVESMQPHQRQGFLQSQYMAFLGKDAGVKHGEKNPIDWTKVNEASFTSGMTLELANIGTITEMNDGMTPICAIEYTHHGDLLRLFSSQSYYRVHEGYEILKTTDQETYEVK